MAETQETISKWATETFGESGTTMRVAIRANEEMAELLRALSVDDNNPKAAEEAADVQIVLARVFTRLGVDSVAEVDRKMAINRKRQWNLDKTGHGYHVREKAPLAMLPDEWLMVVELKLEIERLERENRALRGHPVGEFEGE